MKTTHRRRLNRGDFLKLGGLVSAAGLSGALKTSRVAAQDPPPPTPLRSADWRAASRTVPPPPLPPLRVIVYNRLTFGPRPGDFGYFQGLGSTPEERLETWLDQQLNPGAIDDSDCVSRLAGYTTLNKSLQQLWTDHFRGEMDSSQPMEETEAATWIRAVYSKRQLLEVLVDFWHNHFNVYGWSYVISSVFVHYDRDVIRAHALGNFRQMLEAVATSPAMLYYLDNYISQGAGFNENYARETLELHTMGAENYLGVMNPLDVEKDENGIAIGYVDNDVYEAARAFTGWSFDYYGSGDTGVFEYKTDYHDRANKLFLGHYIPADQEAMKDGRDVFDLLATHEGTARHISRKLCRRLVSDTPPESLVEQAAAVFLDNTSAPDQIKKVVRTIILSDEFKNTWGEKIKRPFEAVAGFLRATNAQFAFSSDFRWNYDDSGQELFSNHSPDGYPDKKDDWNHTTSFLMRWRMCNQMIEGWIDDTTIDVLSQTPGDIRSPNSITDYWVSRILGRPVHPVENRDELVDFLAQGRNPDYDLTQEQFEERLPRMVALLLMSPDFQLR